MKRMRFYVGLIFVVFVVFLGCSEQKPAPLSTDFAGTWLGSAENTGSPNPTFRLEIRQENGAITGSIDSKGREFVEADITDSRIENGVLYFHAKANGDTQYKDHLFIFSVRREADSLKGTWTDILEGMDGPFLLDLER